jgi:hypothetical protein
MQAAFQVLSDDLADYDLRSGLFGAHHQRSDDGIISASRQREQRGNGDGKSERRKKSRVHVMI